MKPEQKIARTAGLLYLIYILVQMVADVFVRSPLIVQDDAAATARNITASAGQFRFGYIGDLAAALLFLLAAWFLYRLLKSVDQDIALLFLLLNLAGVAVQVFSDLFLVAGQLLLSGGETLSVFAGDQLQALMMTSLELNDKGFMMAQIFFGAWLFPLGYLVYRSGFLPRILGIILMTHSVFWLMTFLQYFLLPDFTAITYISYPLGFIAEFGLSLWLLIKGVNAQDQRRGKAGEEMKAAAVY